MQIDAHIVEPLVYVIVITFNGKHHLELCLPSLQRTVYPNYRIMLVDNASHDGSSEYVEEHFPDVRIIRNAKNYGFAKGNNIAMQIALREGAQYVCLLNDDTKILDPNWLQHATKIAGHSSNVGMVGFELTTDTASALPTEVIAKDVQRISGCALLIKREVLERLGYFDEVYFAYAEESDLEARAIKAGYRLQELNIPLYHKGSGSFSQFPVKFAFLFIRNWLRFSIKQESLGKALMRPFIIFDLLCNPFPFRRDSAGISVIREKIDTGSWGTNMLLLIAAVLWNIIYLPQSLFMRCREHAKIKLARKLSCGVDFL
jgi:GT2 family glycosyltransferase